MRVWASAAVPGVVMGLGAVLLLGVDRQQAIPLREPITEAPSPFAEKGLGDEVPLRGPNRYFRDCFYSSPESAPARRRCVAASSSASVRGRNATP